MPAGPGESLITTLFGDVHYYFNDPTSKPLHHRFDRGSYVYLYHNAVQRQTKLEVANAAGTPDQDAFHGYLNHAHIRYSHLQPNLITLVINTSALPDHSTWHLPSFDLTNQQKYLHKIHALDIYLWTEKDAATLLNHLKSVVGPDRMDIKNAPASRSSYASNEHHDSMSPVVQQLEKTAIGSQFAPRSASTISASSFAGPPTAPASSFAGPPTATASSFAGPPTAPVSSFPGPPTAPVSSFAGPPTSAAPVSTPPPVMGYNPAAPAAPEPVTYREPTPPPPEDGTGTGLQNIGRYDNGPQLQSATGFQPQQSSFMPSSQSPAYFTGPPAAQRPGPPTHTPSFGPTATSTISHNPANPTASPPPPPPPAPAQQQPGQYANIPAHLQQQFASYSGTPGFNQISPPPPPPNSTQTSPPPPVGGYSSYSYTNAQAQQQNHSAADVHSQVYRPTEAESSGHGPKSFFKRTATDGSTGSKKDTKKDTKNRLNDGIQGIDSKVSGLLGRLDKMF